jgi:hypothetical protein
VLIKRGSFVYPTSNITHLTSHFPAALIPNLTDVDAGRAERHSRRRDSECDGPRRASTARPRECATLRLKPVCPPRPSESGQCQRRVSAAAVVGGGQEARFGCEFGSFFSCAAGATPSDLIKRGIYSSIAVPLKGGAWREVSMVLLSMALGMCKEQVEAVSEGHDVLQLGVAAINNVAQYGVSQVRSGKARKARLSRGLLGKAKQVHVSRDKHTAPADTVSAASDEDVQVDVSRDKHAGPADTFSATSGKGEEASELSEITSVTIA